MKKPIYVLISLFSLTTLCAEENSADLLAPEETMVILRNSEEEQVAFEEENDLAEEAVALSDSDEAEGVKQKDSIVSHAPSTSAQTIEELEESYEENLTPVFASPKTKILNLDAKADEKQIAAAPAAKEAAVKKVESTSPTLEINLGQVYAGSPVIYSLLITMSIFALFISLYQVLSLKKSTSLSEMFLRNLRTKLLSNQYDEALTLCQQNENVFGKMVAAGISAREHGLPIMLETMKAEGKRATVTHWQRIALLNDMAIIAPMLGLLGTVLGLFYAFYDLNRSRESISSLFDGLGISVGTTVAGLIVAIFAMMLHSFAKYRLIRMLSRVENEAQALASMIDSKKI